MQLTKRDIEIIKFINEFGYCEMPQIMERFLLKKTWTYVIMQRLIALGFVKHRRIFYGRPGIYFVTQNGSRLTDLPPLKKVILGQYEHQRLVFNVYIKLRSLYPEAYWLSERRLKHDKFFDGVGKLGHISDGILVFPDGKQFAIEVELTAKGKNRIEKILKWYGAQLAIKEVWYYCSPQVIPVLTKLSSKMPFVKIHNLEKFLHDQ